MFHGVQWDGLLSPGSSTPPCFLFLPWFSLPPKFPHCSLSSLPPVAEGSKGGAKEQTWPLWPQQQPPTEQQSPQFLPCTSVWLRGLHPRGAADGG